MTEIKEKTEENNCFVLYMTESCHLCEEALALLNDLHRQMLELASEANYSLPETGAFSIEKKDVAQEESLFEAYGKRIPVLIFAPSGEELGWPFDIQQAYQFIFPKLGFQ